VQRVMAATAQDPAEGKKERQQADDQRHARQNILADARAGQAVGDGVEHCIVNTVAGKVVAGVEGNIKHNKQAQHTQDGGKPPRIAACLQRVDSYRGNKQDKREKFRQRSILNSSSRNFAGITL